MDRGWCVHIHQQMRVLQEQCRQELTLQVCTFPSCQTGGQEGTQGVNQLGSQVSICQQGRLFQKFKMLAPLHSGRQSTHPQSFDVNFDDACHAALV